MALIAMAVYDPPGQSRHELLNMCLGSMDRTVDYKFHRLVLVSNGITQETRDVFDMYQRYWPERISIIEGNENVGTARAINKAWLLRQSGECCAKVDSDIVFNTPGWLDLLQEAVCRDPVLGIAACKRKDCSESPLNTPGQWSHSELIQLPHEPGQKWIHVERVHHAMGSAQLYNSALLDKIGFLVQMGKYGFDDSLAAVRCKAAGFYSAFVCGIEIDHPDPGNTDYQRWKEQVSGERMDKFMGIAKEIMTKRRTYFAGPAEDWD